MVDIGDRLYLRNILPDIGVIQLTDVRDGRILAKRDQNHLDGAPGDILTWCAGSVRLVSWVR